jgi:hypothetical protein
MPSCLQALLHYSLSCKFEIFAKVAHNEARDAYLLLIKSVKLDEKDGLLSAILLILKMEAISILLQEMLIKMIDQINML